MNAETAQRYARCIAVLYLLTLLAGGWGESYVPSLLLQPGSVAATAHKLSTSLPLFRASFLAYLLEATCDITLNVLLYALLRPVSRTLALLAVCFGLIGTSIYVAAELLYFAAALPALDADVARVISPDTRATLTYLCLTLYGYVNGLFATFYGIAAVLRGLLMFRSGYLPRPLGALLLLGGVGFLLKNILVVLAPEHDSSFALWPMFAAFLALILWLAIKGVDRAQWEARQAALPSADR